MLACLCLSWDILVIFNNGYQLFDNFMIMNEFIWAEIEMET